MRHTDVKRNRAMFNIRLHARALLILSEEYEKAYKDKELGADEQRQTLDDIWDIIIKNQAALTNVIMDGGL